MKELVEYVAKGMVDHPDAVRVTESADRTTIFLELAWPQAKQGA